MGLLSPWFCYRYIEKLEQDGSTAKQEASDLTVLTNEVSPREGGRGPERPGRCLWTRRGQPRFCEPREVAPNGPAPKARGPGTLSPAPS